MDPLIVHGGDDVVGACERWREALPYPTTVLVLEVERCADTRAALALGELPVPVIGHATDAVRDTALELWLACDIRVAGLAATFGIGDEYVPAAGLTYRLPRVVGRSAALDLLLVRDSVGAETALRIGLATRLGDAASARDLLERLQGLPPVAARFTKEAVLRGLELTLEQGLRLETDLYALLQTTADRVEGLTAWREQRPATFHGD